MSFAYTITLQVNIMVQVDRTLSQQRFMTGSVKLRCFLMSASRRLLSSRSHITLTRPIHCTQAKSPLFIDVFIEVTLKDTTVTSFLKLYKMSLQQVSPEAAYGPQAASWRGFHTEAQHNSYIKNGGAGRVWVLPVLSRHLEVGARHPALFFTQRPWQ